MNHDEPWLEMRWDDHNEPIGTQTATALTVTIPGGNIILGVEEAGQYCTHHLTADDARSLARWLDAAARATTT